MAGKTRKTPLYAVGPARKTAKKKVAMTDLKEAVKDEVKKELSREVENKYACIHTLGDHSTFNPATGGNVASGWITTSILSNAVFLQNYFPRFRLGQIPSNAKGLLSGRNP